MLLSTIDSVSRIYILRFILGNDAYVWLYDPSPWYRYYYQADDAIAHCLWHFTYIYFTFFLGNDAYVWLYDPTLWYRYLADDAIVHC